MVAANYNFIFWYFLGIIMGMIFYPYSIFNDVEPTEYCYELNNDTLYMSRLPLDNPKEELREYYLNNTWVVKCN